VFSNVAGGFGAQAPHTQQQKQGGSDDIDDIMGKRATVVPAACLHTIRKSVPTACLHTQK